MLSPEYALFLRLRWGGWNILVGLLGLVLPQKSFIGSLKALIIIEKTDLPLL